jgi:hypothetical protein
MLQSFTVIAKNTNYIKNGNKSIQKRAFVLFFTIPPHPKPPGKNGIFRFPDNLFFGEMKCPAIANIILARTDKCAYL